MHHKPFGCRVARELTAYSRWDPRGRGRKGKGKGEGKKGEGRKRGGN